MKSNDNAEFEVEGQNERALFTLKVHRGEGMALLGMNWKKGRPPEDFVGFSIEYRIPGGDRFLALKNRLSFADQGKTLSTLLAPLQKFRWIHFPFDADLDGAFTYLVKPVFMDKNDILSYGEAQQVDIALKRQTFESQLNIAFTRGMVSSQAFVDRFSKTGNLGDLLPASGTDGLAFEPAAPQAERALAWMGFEARKVILDILDSAIKDKNAEVKVVAFDLDLPEVVDRLEKLGKRLSIIIDDSVTHASEDSSESKAAERLSKSSRGRVKRQHMGQLQHNKMVIVKGGQLQVAVAGSTNLSWRGLFIQNNNLVAVYGAKAIEPFLNAFENYWQFDRPKDFFEAESALWHPLSLNGIDASVSFSPHASKDGLLDAVAQDMASAGSSLLYSLAFLAQTEGPVKQAILQLEKAADVFIYGISDRKVGGMTLRKPSGNVAPVYPSPISERPPGPFHPEPAGGSGVRMHHKFVVIDFDKPSARVYLGSYNFSDSSDTKNGENLLLIRNRKAAVSYMIEALRLFDHYHFRVSQNESKESGHNLALAKPPRKKGDKPWWLEYYVDPVKIRDREIFA